MPRITIQLACWTSNIPHEWIWFSKDVTILRSVRKSPAYMLLLIESKLNSFQVYTTCVDVCEETIFWKASLLVVPNNPLLPLLLFSPPPASPERGVDTAITPVIDTLIDKLTQIADFSLSLSLSWLLSIGNEHVWTRVEPACGQIEAGRGSEKLVFFLRRVDIWLILLKN